MEHWKTLEVAPDEEIWHLGDIFLGLDMHNISEISNVLQMLGLQAVPAISEALSDIGFLAPPGTSLNEIILYVMNYQTGTMYFPSLQPFVTLRSGLTSPCCSTCLRSKQNLRRCWECGLWDCKACSFWCSMCPQGVEWKYTICRSCHSRNVYLYQKRKIWMCHPCRFANWGQWRHPPASGSVLSAAALPERIGQTIDS